MIDDRQRAMLQHPVRMILRRSAQMGSTPDEQELAELNVDEHTVDRVREAARSVADLGAGGGLRSRHVAAAQAERLTEDIVSRIPREFSDSVPVDRGDDGGDPGELAERIMQRRGAHPTSTESSEEASVRQEAIRLLSHPRASADD